MKTLLLFSIIFLFSSKFLLSQSITTGQLSELEFCSGSLLEIPFSIEGEFQEDNVFVAQISNNSFKGFYNIGNLKSKTSGIVTATIPDILPSGSNYRIRIISSNPYIVGIDNGEDISIVQKPLSGLMIMSDFQFVLENEPVNFTILNEPELYYDNAKWSFGEGASVVDWYNFIPPELSYSITGEKNVTCELSSSKKCMNPVKLDYTLNVLGCDVHIDSSAFVDSVKLEYGLDDEPIHNKYVWILPSGSLTLYYASNQIFFLEQGSSLTIKSHITNCIFYLKPGSSLVLNVRFGKCIILKSPEASSVYPDSLEARIKECNDLNYDYKTAPKDGIDIMERLGYLSTNDNSLQRSISFSPNPSSNRIKIRMIDDRSRFSKGKVEVSSNFGEMLFNITIDEGIYSQGIDLDVSAYPSGLYFCTVQIGSYVETQPFLVIH